MRGREWGGYAAAAVAAAGCAAGAVWSARVGWADYEAGQETAAGTRRALQTTPGRAEYYARLALLTADDNPVGATYLLRRAVEANPAEARWWIELGLRYEGNGEKSRVEECLLRAAEESREYLPRWTLANYYYRRNDTERFWHWAKEAAAMAYGDPQPLFRLCGRVEEDGRLIERLGMEKPEMRAGYLAYLAEQGRIDLIGPSSRRVLEGNREQDVPLVLAACDRLLEAGRVGEAEEIWKGLGEAKRIPYGAGGGREETTNGDFGEAPTSHGFDWRLPGGEGITAAREEGGGLRLTFSGRQAENCEALTQMARVREKTSYELRWRYRTGGIAAGTGLSWRVTDGSGKRELGVGESLSSEGEAEGTVRFRTPEGCEVARLALGYRRAAGTTRIEGYVALREARLRAAGQPSEGPARSRVMK